MSRRRPDNFHNRREYPDDEPVGLGLFDWLRLQFNRLLAAGGDPTPATILYTHRLDDELSALPPGSARPKAAARNPWVEDRAND